MSDVEERSQQVADYVAHLKDQVGQSIQAHADASDDPTIWNAVSLVQGSTAMALHLAAQDSVFIADVDVPQDFEGNYLDHLIVTTRGGNRVRVTFAPE
jgi:hypothetical protein